MKALVEGHEYALDPFEKEPNGFAEQVLIFIHKEVNDKDELVTIKNGTTNEEVVKVLIDRVTFLNKKLPCVENKVALFHLKSALDYLELRTLRRLFENVEGTPNARAKTGEEGSGNNL